LEKKTFPQELDKVIATLPTEGPLTRDEVRTWAYWMLLLVNLLDAEGLYYRGESFKSQGWATLLVVKVARDGIPLVAFVTERTPTACMGVFLRQLEERRVEWRDDRFG
jgi:hypothetical protein